MEKSDNKQSANMIWCNVEAVYSNVSLPDLCKYINSVDVLCTIEFHIYLSTLC